MAWPAVEERAGGALVRGEIGGVVPRTENDPVSDSFNLFGAQSGSRWDHGRTSSRCVCVCLCVCVHAPTSISYHSVGIELLSSYASR